MIPSHSDTDITLADIRLLPTVVRFDQAYFTAFGCDKRKIVDAYPSVMRWASDMYAQPGVAHTVDFQSYYGYFANPKWYPQAEPLPDVDTEQFSGMLMMLAAGARSKL